MRIGVHSGPVVGGVVGSKKYIYDVFGDTINTASRLEQCAMPLRINVSEATWQLVRDEYEFQERGSVEVKGKGEMRMYYLGD
jgi:class 3 adenylate cyclase